MRYDSHAATPTVTMDGQLPPPIANRVSRVVVATQRNLPAMCEVEFFDDDRTVIDDPTVVPGATLEVRAGAASEDPAQQGSGPIFSGEVVAVEASFMADDAARVVVRGYDRSHRMHRTRRTRTFLMQPDSAVVSEIASDHDLAARVDDTGGPHEYLCQRNQTDWEFLCERAREIGFEVAVVDDQLVFREAGRDPAAGAARQLVLGENLHTLRLRATSAEQATTTRVRGWDAQRKESLEGVAAPPEPENEPADQQLQPSAVAGAFGDTSDVVTARALHEPARAEQHATARRNHAASAAFEAEGTCSGNPALVPGGTVDIDNVGDRLSGTYTLTTVRHVFDEDGFTTSFTITGRHDRSLLGLAQPGVVTRANGSAHAAERLPGAVVATVTNSADPADTGRVKVELPWLADQAESHWAPVVSVGAGPERGLQVIPEVGDEVVVVFDHGDVRRPIVLGGLFNDRDQLPAPDAVAGGHTEVRVLRTRAGHTLTFDDTGGGEQVTLVTARGARIAVVDAPEPTIELADGSGNTVTMGADSVAIDSAANLDLTATGTITLDGQAGVTLRTAATMDVEGSVTNVTASGPLSLKGTPLQLN